MPLLNDILVFFLKRRSEHIDHFRQNPIDVQYHVFHELIEAAKDTEWGRAYDYRSIQNIRDFQNRVPVRSYEELFPYIERILKGEQNVLWPSDVEWFAKSSGTTNARSKYIPVTPESLEECNYKGGKDVMSVIIENKPDTQLFEGKGLSIGGSLSDNPYNSLTKVGDISAIIMHNLPAWADFIRTPPIEVALIDNWEDKLIQMTEICGQENVTSILGVPTWSIVLLDRLMEKFNKNNMLEIWPNFEVFVHGAVAFDPYRALFQKKYFPTNEVLYLETYNASEGFFALQDDFSRPGEMLLMLDYGIFYEFLPISEWEKEYPNALTLDEVEVGQNYALVISASNGLWRYKVGDTVKFTSKYPFRLKVSGRTKHFINVFGEEVVIENADAAIIFACKETGAIMSDYTAGPVYIENGSKGRHEWIIEFSNPPHDLAFFTDLLDKHLRHINSDYDAKRFNDIALLPPIVHSAPKQTFYNWMNSRGKLGGQHKVPRLSNSREYLNSLLQILS
jgi:GH3 auxin-responsive promoter